MTWQEAICQWYQMIYRIGYILCCFRIKLLLTIFFQLWFVPKLKWNQHDQWMIPRYYKLTKEPFFPKQRLWKLGHCLGVWTDWQRKDLHYGAVWAGVVRTVVWSSGVGFNRLIVWKITGSTHHCLGFFSSVSKSKLNLRIFGCKWPFLRSTQQRCVSRNSLFESVFVAQPTTIQQCSIPKATSSECCHHDFGDAASLWLVNGSLQVKECQLEIPPTKYQSGRLGHCSP